MVAGDDEDFVGSAAPERAEGHGVVGRLQYPVAEPLLGGRRRADQTSAGEPRETGLLLGKLPRHERDAEQLAVRVSDGGAGLAAVIDDHLAVAQPGRVLVLLDAVADREHDEVGLLVRERGHRAVVVGRDDQHFVDSACRGFGEHRPTILHDERNVTFERRVPVRNDPHEPAARGPVRLQSGRHRAFVAGAEGARNSLEGVEGRLSRDEEGLPLAAVGRHRDPPPRKGIKTQLIHARPTPSFKTALTYSFVITLNATATQRPLRRTLPMTAPVYDLLVVLHVLSAVIGFGSVGVSGAYAARARSSANPRQDATLVRYFHPGTNWAERTLLVTPVLGAIVLFAGDRSAASEIWPWIGLGGWTCAAAMATAWCWPAERRIQTWLSGAPRCTARPTRAGAVPGLADFRKACRAVQWGASAISICFVVAVVFMVGQPR